jgi:hypothetical protein
MLCIFSLIPRAVQGQQIKQFLLGTNSTEAKNVGRLLIMKLTAVCQDTSNKKAGFEFGRQIVDIYI